MINMTPIPVVPAFAGMTVRGSLAGVTLIISNGFFYSAARMKLMRLSH
jgi:hypothetical protein